MKSKNQTKRVDKMTSFLVGALLLWVTFAFSNSGGDPGFAIRLIGLIAFCLAYSLYFFIYKASPLPILGKLTTRAMLGFGLFIIIGVISSISAINSNASILPIVINLSFVLLIYLFIHAFNSGLRIGFVSGILTVLGGLLALLGILQYYKFMPEGLQIASPPSVFQFNRNFYGSSQVLLLPFALVSAYLLTGLKRYFSIVSIGLIVFSVSISQTRSAVLSMILLGLVVVLIGSVNSWKSINEFRYRAFIAIIVVAFLALAAGLSNNYFGSVQHNIQGFFETETSNQRQSSIGERLTIWKGSVGIIKDNPLIGVGPGNWQLHAAAADEQPHRVRTGRIVSNRAHNVYLEVLSETGLMGLFFYSSFLIFTSLMFSKCLFVESKINTVVLFLVGGYVAFLTDQFFSFPNLQPTHLVLLAIILGYTFSGEPFAPTAETRRKRNRIVPAIILAFSSFALYTSFSFFFFEKNLKKALRSTSTGDLETALYYLNNASNSLHSIDRSGDSPELRKALIYNQMGKPEMALSELRYAWIKNPTSPRVYAVYGDSYLSKGDRKNASLYYQKAFDVQSKNFILGKSLAIVYYEEKEFEKCLKVLQMLREKDLDRDPKLSLIFKVSKIHVNREVN